MPSMDERVTEEFATRSNDGIVHSTSMSITNDAFLRSVVDGIENDQPFIFGDATIVT